LKREFLTTGDGSVTIHLPEWNEQYHSKHGAIAEAIHVFIKSGLHYFFSKNPTDRISILEIGFGTGLNAFLTFLEADKNSWKVLYTGIEAYPVALNELKQLNYPEKLNMPEQHFFKLHETAWETPSVINSSFELIKRQQFFSEINDKDQYELIYFDAFGARVQPDLWTEDIFRIMYEALVPGGILVTYSAKGSVRRAMQSVGFTVNRLPGPPGKREMLRAVK
jgi:tRNA U34 5-methylaminomethyl-2-thiouridine-forming methyltransferase MnmC